MKRWRSRISIVIAGLSLLACVAALFMWARSLTRAEMVIHDTVRVVPPRADKPTPEDGFANQWLAERCDWVFSSASGGFQVIRAISESYRANESELSFARQGQGWRYDWYRPETERKDDGPHFRNILDWRVPGLGMSTYATGGGTGYKVELPMWLVALVTVLPFVWVVVRKQRASKRRGLGLCVACGYDMRGIGGAVCPECGAKAST
jgi:hypothetical protein